MYSLLSLLLSIDTLAKASRKDVYTYCSWDYGLCMRCSRGTFPIYGYTGAIIWQNPLAWLGSLIALMIAYYLFKNKFPKEQVS